MMLLRAGHYCVDQKCSVLSKLRKMCNLLLLAVEVVVHPSYSGKKKMQKKQKKNQTRRNETFFPTVFLLASVPFHLNDIRFYGFTALHPYAKYGGSGQLSGPCAFVPIYNAMNGMNDRTRAVSYLFRQKP